MMVQSAKVCRIRLKEDIKNEADPTVVMHQAENP